MKLRNWIFLIVLIIFAGLATLIFRPVPIPDEKDCLIAKGTVNEIYEAGVKDVFFKLQGQDQLFYINRGLERGLNLNDLKTELTNKEVVIRYPKYWTPLDFSNSVRHISKIEHQGRTIFTELD